jgi:poly(3-hydroxyalkanoate) synthetase
MRPVPKHLNNWKLASAIGTHQRSTCRGAYYLQVVEHVFKENRLATGRFVALGRRVELSELRCPLFLLAARDEDVVAPEQIFATERRVSCKPRALEKTVAPGGHLGLFMGRETLAHTWPDIARWLSH